MEIVSFEIAKKLKEKGFPQHITDEAYIIDNYGEEEYNIGDRLPIPLVPDYMDDVAAPTISQVLKWLREEKKIFVIPSISPRINEEVKWSWDVGCFDNKKIFRWRDGNYGYNTYEQAVLTGISWTLDNLI